MISRIQTGALSNISIKFSPFEGDKMVVASSQNFGIVGTGAVKVLQLDPAKGLQEIQSFQTPDSSFDACFNESNQAQVLSAGGDKTMKLWQMGQPQPVAIFQGHQAEVQGVEWNHLNKISILSCSMDQTLKVWNSVTPQAGPQASFQHNGVVNQGMWHPTHESIFGSCGADQMVNIWDLRNGKAVKQIHAHQSDVLSIDFNKYENFIASSGTDNQIKIFDLRGTTSQPLLVLTGHQLAVRKIKFSPYHANILASSSYDMSVKIWDCNVQRSINQFDHHTEFVTGLDFNLFVEGQLATASWDKTCSIVGMQLK